MLWKKDIEEARYMQFSHLFLSCQWTTHFDLNARVTNIELVFNQRWFQPLLWAISIAVIAPLNSAHGEFEFPKFKAKAPKNSTLQILNKPPQEEE